MSASHYIERQCPKQSSQREAFKDPPQFRLIIFIFLVIQDKHKLLDLGQMFVHQE